MEALYFILCLGVAYALIVCIVRVFLHLIGAANIKDWEK